jgi:hypothetical protein
MQEKDLPRENKVERFENLEDPEILGFLDSEYCPTNFRKFYEAAQRNSQIDNYMGVDVIAAGFISNFLFWLSKWVYTNLPKIIAHLYGTKRSIKSSGEDDQKLNSANIMNEVYEPYERVTKEVKMNLDDCGIVPDLPEQFIKYISNLPNLSQTEREFIIFWGKIREFASDDLGIYMRDWPQFVKYEVFKSKLIGFSYPGTREDIERSLETPDEDELRYILAPFYHPREGTFILYDTDEAAERQDVKRVFSPSVETLLSHAIHECIGHGFFYQHTAVGNKLSSPEAVQLLMTERVEPSFETERSKEIKRLRLLRKKTHVLREGFAYWVQLFLLRKLKKTYPDLDLNKEIEEVSQLVHEGTITKWNLYSVGFHLFKKIEEQNGELCAARAFQIACNMISPGDFEQRLINISETFEKVKEDTGFPPFRKNDLNWFDYAVNYVWNYKLPRIRFSPVIEFSYAGEQNSD